LRAKDLFSTTLVEIAVDNLARSVEKDFAKKFSTFPQALFSTVLWKCGKLEVKRKRRKA
jgi:hypothetical protein